MSYSIFNTTEAALPKEIPAKVTMIDGRPQPIYPGVLEAMKIVAGSTDRIGTCKEAFEGENNKVTITCKPDEHGSVYRYVLVKDSKTNDIRGRVFNDTAMSDNPIDLNETGSWPVYVLMCAFDMHGTPYASAYNVLKEHALSDILCDEEKREMLINGLATACRTACELVNTGRFPKPSGTGKIKSLSKEEKRAVSKSIVGGEDTGFDYSLHEDVPEKLKAFIPVIPKWYIYPAWVKNIAKMAKCSPDLRNFYLTGEAGTGKTFGAQAIASLLGLPYGKLTCNEDFEIFDIFGQLLPVTESNEEDLTEKLSGFTDNDFFMCPEKVAEAVGSKSSELKDILIAAAKHKGQEYHYVKSDAVLAYEYGGVCEIQEAKVVRKAGTLVGMNNMLELGNNKSITLPTGEVIKKHPNCIFVFTSNESYEGCRSMNQSVLSRMNMQMHIDLPEAKVMAERVMRKTGFSDPTYMERMVNVVNDIHEYCEKQDITDGVCGMRELEAWASVVKTRLDMGDALTDELVKECGEWTVLNKTSQARDNVEEIRTAKWDAAF